MLPESTMGDTSKKKEAVNNLRTQLGLSNYKTLDGKKMFTDKLRVILEKAFEAETETPKIIENFIAQFTEEILDFWA